MQVRGVIVLKQRMSISACTITVMTVSVRIYTMLIPVMMSWITLSAAQNTIADLIRQRSELSMVSKLSIRCAQSVYLYWSALDSLIIASE